MPIQRWSDDIWIVKLAGESDPGEVLDNARDRLTKADPTPSVVIDTSGVGHLNSSNLAQMLRLRKLVHDSGGRLRVAGPSDAVWGVLLTTGLDKVFAFDPDPATALAHVQIGTE